jgi:hypothetical protein
MHHKTQAMQIAGEQTQGTHRYFLGSRNSETQGRLVTKPFDKEKEYECSVFVDNMPDAHLHPSADANRKKGKRNFRGIIYVPFRGGNF